MLSKLTSLNAMQMEISFAAAYDFKNLLSSILQVSLEHYHLVIFITNFKNQEEGDEFAAK